MNNIYFSSYYTQTFIITFFVLMSICFAFFLDLMLPWMWFAFATFEVLGFFYFTQMFSKKWRSLPVEIFTKKLLIVSFVLRVIWVVFSYFFFEYHTGFPFEFNAGDSLTYHAAGKSILYHGFLNLDSALWGLGMSDRGYPVFIGIIYSVFGDNLIMPRLFNAFFGAFSAVLVYRLAKKLFSEEVGRLAGVMFMLMPNLIYYCGVHLKETLMIFLVLLFLIGANDLSRTKVKYYKVIMVILLGSSLLFFRTVLFASLFFALFSMLLLVRKTGSNVLQRFIIGIYILVVFWFTYSDRIISEFDYLVENTEAQSQSIQSLSTLKRGNRLSEYGSAIVFAPIIIIAPIPTFVNIEHQKVQMMLSGGYFVKNVLAFFVLLSLISFIRKRQFRKYILILSFMLAYLAILAQSRFALSERFHLVILPIFLILAAYGVTQVNKKNKKYFIPYLVFLVILVIGWNWFKLSGRGMI